MIRVTVKRSDNRSITAFTVQGHAGYAVSGSDIVCAGVSAVTVGAVNAVEALLSVELPSDMKDGWLSVRIPAQLPDDVSDKVQLILESMIVMLKTIQDSYGNYMQVKEHYGIKEVDKIC